MTCVVAKPGVLYSDSRETLYIKRNSHKHFQVHNYLVGTAGDSDVLTAAEHVFKWPKRPNVKILTRWLHDHQNDSKSDFNKCCLLVVTTNRLFVCEGLYVYEVDSCAAIGSGAPYALGYLRGQPDDLKGAVEAACYYDPYCAGPVRGPFEI